MWGLGNDSTKRINDQDTYIGIHILSNGGAGNSILKFYQDGDLLDYMNYAWNTNLAIKIQRDISATSNGSITISIYSEGTYQEGSLVSSFTVALNSKDSYQYLYGISAHYMATPTTLSAFGGTISNLEIDYPFARDDVYIIGKTQGEVHDYRIVDLERTNDTYFKISAIEYNENIYYHQNYDAGITAI